MIYIEMKMPEKCSECRFKTVFKFCKAMPDNFCEYTKDEGKPEWCPLKEQEAIKPYMDYDGQDVWRCGKCGNSLMHPSYYESDEDAKNHIRYCSHCGKAVKWDE